MKSVMYLTAGLMVGIVGCGSSNNAPMYATPAAADSSLATLRTEGVRLDSVDGLKLEDSRNVKLAAGEHKIAFSFNSFRGTIGGNVKGSLQYKFAAGEKYFLTKEDKMYSFSAPRLLLKDDASGAILAISGGDSLFKIGGSND